MKLAFRAKSTTLAASCVGRDTRYNGHRLFWYHINLFWQFSKRKLLSSIFLRRGSKTAFGGLCALGGRSSVGCKVRLSSSWGRWYWIIPCSDYSMFKYETSSRLVALVWGVLPESLAGITQRGHEESAELFLARKNTLETVSWTVSTTRVNARPCREDGVANLY
jgi:hypothetical protein